MNKLLGKVVAGSRLYGLENANSDHDEKGIFLPSFNELVLQRASKTESFKNEITRTEYEAFGLQYFLKIAANGEDIPIVMLHAPRSKVLVDSEIYSFLRENRRKFHTKRMTGALGYAKSQAMKYSLRADRMLAVKQALDKLRELIDRGVLKIAQAWDELPVDGKYLIKTEVVDSRESDKRVWEVSGKGCTANTNPTYCYSFLSDLYNKYGDRVKVAAGLQSLDYKSISHAFRTAYQLYHLYTEGDFQFPLPENEFIRKVKEGRVDFLKEEIDNQLNSLITKVEELAEKSSLPQSVDSKWLDNIVLDAYGLKTEWKS